MTISELEDILLSDYPSTKLKEHEEELFKLIPELEKCKGFDQKNPWHIYDVLEHIYQVVDNTDDILDLRYAALFHDIGKPEVFKEDSNGVGHFYNHWLVSEEIFNRFAQVHEFSEKRTKTISKLIFYHDKSIDKLDDRAQSCLLKEFSPQELMMLFKLKRADLLAQNEEYNYILNNYDKTEKELLKKY